MIRTMKHSFIILLVIGFLGCTSNLENQKSSPDGKVINQLKNAGSDLSKEHPVEFFVYVPSRESAEQIAEKISGDGFLSVVEKTENSNTWLVYSKKSLVPTEEKMLQIRQRMTDLASSAGGEYDGWGTPVVK